VSNDKWKGISQGHLTEILSHCYRRRRKRAFQIKMQEVYIVMDLAKIRSQNEVHVGFEVSTAVTKKNDVF
jgi:hypothetical protein